jgi:hypothetical protein
LALLLAGCGRVGFDSRPVDAAPDASISLAEELPCDMAVLLDDGNHDPHDVVRWLHDDSGDWLVGAHHYSQDLHKIERHPLSHDAAGFHDGPAEFMVQGDHIDVLSVVPVASGSVLGWNDFVLNTAQTNALAAGMQVTSANPLGTLRIGNPPLVRIGGGALAMIGLDGAGDLVAIGIGEDGAPTGAMQIVATTSDAPQLSNAIALDDGLAITWTAGAGGTCRVAKLATDLTLVAGPVSYGTACDDPQVAWLPASGRIVGVAYNPSAGGLQAASWDLSLNPVSAPHMLAANAHWPRVVTDFAGDSLWLTWAQTPTPQPVMYAHLDGDTNILKMGAPVGTIDETLGHFHTIQRSGYAPVIVWVDTINARTFAAEHPCK